MLRVLTDDDDGVLLFSHYRPLFSRFFSIYAKPLAMMMMALLLLLSQSSLFLPELQTFIGGPSGCALVTSSRFGSSGGRFCWAWRHTREAPARLHPSGTHETCLFVIFVIFVWTFFFFFFVLPSLFGLFFMVGYFLVGFCFVLRLFVFALFFWLSIAFWCVAFDDNWRVFLGGGAFGGSFPVSGKKRSVLLRVRCWW